MSQNLFRRNNVLLLYCIVEYCSVQKEHFFLESNNQPNYVFFKPKRNLFWFQNQNEYCYIFRISLVCYESEIILFLRVKGEKEVFFPG